jgi:plastocyanin
VIVNQKMRYAATAMLIAVAVTASASCTGRTSRSYVVSMMSMTFQPADLKVDRGDTIVWKNDDFLPHTATARDSSWDSKSVDAGATWRYVADKPGRYAYYCMFHPNMQGTIEVR